jgi:hypothetical protein
LFWIRNIRKHEDFIEEFLEQLHASVFGVLHDLSADEESNLVKIKKKRKENLCCPEIVYGPLASGGGL